MRTLADLHERLRATLNSMEANEGASDCSASRDEPPRRGLLWRVKSYLNAHRFRRIASKPGLDAPENRRPVHDLVALEGRTFLECQDLLSLLAVVRDHRGTVLAANRMFKESLTCDEPVGLTLEQLGLPLSERPVTQDMDIELSIDRELRVFSWRDLLVREPGSRRELVFSSARDVTEERRAAHAKDEARLQAEESSHAKSRQLATVVHELRTPLNGILGMSQLLQHTELTPEQRNYLGGISQAGSAMAQLVDDLLDYSTIEAGRFRLNSRAENIRQLLDSVVEMMAPRAHQKGIEIGATVAYDVPALMDFDPARLRQVLFNVIGNAVKFTQVGGVLIRVHLEGARLVITVADTGPGMNEEDRKRIFEEFEQVGDAAERSGGTGLGLSISSRILREFGGDLSVDSRKGIGTTFTISLPAISADAGKEGSDRMLLLRSSRVLLLAPDGPAAEATIASIETLGGRCRHVRTVSEAEWVISNSSRQNLAFTDMIVDHRIGGVDGMGPVASRIRRILLVSPEERGHQRWDAYDAWLIRPLREQSLVDVLRGRLGGGQSHKASVIVDGGVVPEPSFAIGLQVLFAEDDPVSAMMVGAVLRKAGCSVQHVSDLVALEKAASAQPRPDLIVSDLHMPGGELSDVLQSLHRQGVNAPVLVLSGETDSSLKERILAQGAGSILPKPADPHRLLHEIKQLLEMQRQKT
ncbi:hybrid sensor histidine kinase/response regulator [Rhizobium helianthi]|uniref:histidine kinase n=1 Tax=Rhizobium helianthi TaxID=1132695 RepID=A0ABW4M1G5_9HYPH